ncbi:LacI family DNA-binding transcriptional regulator [[Clostridium] innocuum]|uniref:LacI family DNA-binding transcriptional regulator n=1 Tax=Clostridium innocuum TaxID=1522 RepID=UPI003A4DD257
MEQHKYNIIDIARLAQVSTATVSRVLHEKGGYSKETETRVRRVIAECGFQLNKNAQGLRTQKSRNIGVIVPDITNEFFARIIRYLELFFLKHQYSVLICDSHEDIEIEQLHIRNLKEQQVEGIIYISGRNANPIQESAFSIPIVYIDRKPEDVHIFVYSDNRQGGYLAARELIEKQCRSILFLRDQKKASTIRQRRSGYLEALEEAGIAFQESWEIMTKSDYASVFKTVTNLLMQKGCFFDGVFATNDNMALACLHALHAQHIQVPDQVKIVGFDNVSISQFCHPALTTITQNTELMAEAAGDALLKRIHHELDKQEFIIPVSLCVREST